MTLPKYVLYLFCTAPGRRWMGRPPRLRGGAEAAPLNLWSSAAVPGSAASSQGVPEQTPSANSPPFPPTPTPPPRTDKSKRRSGSGSQGPNIYSLLQPVSARRDLSPEPGVPPALCVEMLTCINGRSLCFSFGERTAA